MLALPYLRVRLQGGALHWLLLQRLSPWKSSLGRAGAGNDISPTTLTAGRSPFYTSAATSLDTSEDYFLTRNNFF